MVKFARAPRQVETISLDCSQDKAGKQGTMTGTGKNPCHWDTRWLGRICLSTGGRAGSQRKSGLLSVHLLAREAVTGPGLQGHLKIVYPEAKSHWMSPPETTTNTPPTTVWY